MLKRFCFLLMVALAFAGCSVSSIDTDSNKDSSDKGEVENPIDNETEDKEKPEEEVKPSVQLLPAIGISFDHAEDYVEFGRDKVRFRINFEMIEGESYYYYLNYSDAPGDPADFIYYGMTDSYQPFIYFRQDKEDVPETGTYYFVMRYSIGHNDPVPENWSEWSNIVAVDLATMTAK